MKVQQPMIFSAFNFIILVQNQASLAFISIGSLLPLWSKLVEKDQVKKAIYTMEQILFWSTFSEIVHVRQNSKRAKKKYDSIVICAMVRGEDTMAGFGPERGPSGARAWPEPGPSGASTVPLEGLYRATMSHQLKLKGQNHVDSLFL